MAAFCFALSRNVMFVGILNSTLDKIKILISFESPNGLG